MAEYVTVGTTLDALLPTTRLFDDHDAAHDIQLRFTSVPAASLGGAFGVAEAIDELIEYLAQNNDVVAGKSIAIWGPVESMLMWAASYLSDVGEGTLVRQPVFGMPEEGLYSVRETAVGIARDETARLQSASSSLPDRRVGLTLPTYGVLSEAQVFAVRNSPLRVIDGAGLAAVTAVAPGVAFVVTDGSVVATVISSAAGLFITYIAIPALRGVGSGLEEVLHQWVLRLAPDPKKRRK